MRYFTTLQVADIFQITTEAVLLWHRQHEAPKFGDNQWDLSELIPWWAENIYEPENNAHTELYKVKLENWKHKTRREKIKADILEESVIAKADVTKAWAFRVREVTAALLALAMRLAPRLEGLEEIEIRKEITDEVWDILNKFSREGRYIG